MAEKTRANFPRALYGAVRRPILALQQWRLLVLDGLLNDVFRIPIRIRTFRHISFLYRVSPFARACESPGCIEFSTPRRVSRFLSPVLRYAFVQARKRALTRNEEKERSKRVHEK